MSSFVTLLVEDDPLQRAVLSDVLKSEGLEVVECATAEAAELIVASTGNELLALITDHNLAGSMTGTELAEYAREHHPHLNIVVMSGGQIGVLPGKDDLPFQAVPARNVLAGREGQKLDSRAGDRSMH